MYQDQQPTFPKVTPEHVPWLDGLRGTAALWVLLSHVQILTGMKAIPILSWGDLAVDLFMMLSGFLMAHHYIQRQAHEPWDTSKTAYVFWIRRFFRIAPLYYVILLVAFILGPWLGDNRAAIAAVWPDTATPPSRYFDQSITNAIAHISFTFGFLPNFAFRTPLPDWSIGLEMQFYLVFPLIMLGIARIGPIKASLVIIFACFILHALFPGYFRQFDMPSFLPIKLYVFLMGIWIAVSRTQNSMLQGFWISLFLGGLWAIIERSEQSIARVVMVAAMFYLMNDGTLPGSAFLQRRIDKLRQYLFSPVSEFLGNTSYATYLVHLIIVLPVAGQLSRLPQYRALDPTLRFALCLSIAIPIVYTLSWLLYNAIEKPGIRAGKAVVRAVHRNAGAVKFRRSQQ